MKVTCMLDMDGVLVDMVKGCFDFFNKQIPYRDVRWNLPPQLGMTQDEFWNPLGYDFWANLDWTHEGEELLSELESIYEKNIVLVSSPCDTPGCDEGKRAWVKKHLPEYKRRCFIGQDKFHLAAPNKILIDDHDPNIDKFREFRGHGCLVPRPWNRLIEATDEHGRFNVKDLINSLPIH